MLEIELLRFGLPQYALRRALFSFSSTSVSVLHAFVESMLRKYTLLR